MSRNARRTQGWGIGGSTDACLRHWDKGQDVCGTGIVVDTLVIKHIAVQARVMGTTGNERHDVFGLLFNKEASGFRPHRGSTPKPPVFLTRSLRALHTTKRWAQAPIRARL